MRVGFVGAGEQGLQNLIPALLQIDGTKVVAICDLSPEKAQRAAARCGGAKAFGSIVEMLDARYEGAPLDAVVAAAYPRVHIELAEAALQRRIPVFVEKPPCYNRAELGALVESAARNGVVTGVGLNFRFASVIQRVQEAIRSSEFGPVAYIDVLHAANKPRAPLWDAASTARAVLLAQTIHSLDLAISMGGHVKEFNHRLVKEANDGLLAEIGIEFRSGALARVVSGNLFPDFSFALRVVSRKGHMMTVNNFWELEYRAAGRTAFDGGDGKRWRDAYSPSPLDSGHARTGYVGELAAFLDSVKSKSRFACDFESLIPTYDIIESICQVMESHKGNHSDGHLRASRATADI